MLAECLAPAFRPARIVFQRAQTDPVRGGPPSLRRSGALRRATGHSVSGPARAGWRRLRGAHQAPRGRSPRRCTTPSRPPSPRPNALMAVEHVVPERFERAGERPDAGPWRLRREARAHQVASPPSVRTESGAGRVAPGSGLEPGRVAAPLKATTSWRRCSDRRARGGPALHGGALRVEREPQPIEGGQRAGETERDRPPKAMIDASRTRQAIASWMAGARPARAASRRGGPWSVRPTASCRGRGASP